MPTPTHQKKMRPGKLSQLPPEVRAQLDARLRGQQDTLEGIAAWLEAEHGVTISPQALSMYYRRRVLPESWRYAASTAEALNSVDSAGVSAAAHSALVQAIFEVVTRRGDVPTKELAALGKLLVQAISVQQAERKLHLAERRAEAMETVATAAVSGGLSPETLAAAEEALNLM